MVRVKRNESETEMVRVKRNESETEMVGSNETKVKLKWWGQMQ